MSIKSFTRDQMVFGDESAVAKRADRRGVMVRGERYSLLPLVGLTGVIACHVKRGSFTHTSILRFFEEDVVRPFPLSRTTLADTPPQLPAMNPYPLPNSVCVIDNAVIHHHAKLKKMFEDQGP